MRSFYLALVLVAACGSVRDPEGPDADPSSPDARPPADADPAAPDARPPVDADPLAPDAGPDAFQPVDAAPDPDAIMPADAEGPPPGFPGSYTVDLCAGTACTAGNGLACGATKPCCPGITGQTARDVLIAIEIPPTVPAGWKATGTSGSSWNGGNGPVSSLTMVGLRLNFASGFYWQVLNYSFAPFKATQQSNGDLTMDLPFTISSATCETTFTSVEVTRL